MTIMVIDGRHYPAMSIEDLTITDTMALQRELTVTNISSAKTWPQVRVLMSEWQAMPPEERAEHPEALFLTAVMIWAVRTASGERMTLLDACDVPMSSIQLVQEPTDHTVGKAPASPPAKRKKGKRKGGK